MISDPSLRVRDATAADAAVLAGFAEHTFRATFGEANTDSDMDLHCANSFGVARQLEEIQNPGISTILVEAGTTLVAFAQLRRGAAPACVQGSRPAEIYRLYVASSWHGKGIAQQLMTLLIERAFKTEADGVWLGVWERNPRAIAFYEKAGFESIGEHAFVLGTDRQRDLIMQYRIQGVRVQ